MEKVIIGLSGEMGAGKGTVAHYLVDQYGCSAFRMSDMLRDVLKRLHLEISRENMANMSKVIRENFGQDILSRVIANDALESGRSAVVDGIRRESDIAHLQKMPNFFLVYIEVSLQLRYERLVARAENIGDSTKTFEQFTKEQLSEADRQVSQLKNKAQYILENNGDIQQLYKEVNRIMEEIRGKK